MSEPLAFLARPVDLSRGQGIFSFEDAPGPIRPLFLRHFQMTHVYMKEREKERKEGGSKERESKQES